MTDDIFNEGCKFFNDLILNELLPITNNGCYVGGGAVRNYFEGLRNYRQYSDIDIWVKTPEALQAIIVYFEAKGGKLTHDNNNAKMFFYDGIYWDIHHQFYIEPQKAIYYVEITVNAGFCDGIKFYYPKDFFLHLATKQIVWNCFNGYGIKLLTQRIQKMIKKGYSLSWKESERIEIEMTNFLIERNKK